MKLKFTKSSTKNKVFIKIWKNYNTTSSKHRQVLDKLSKKEITLKSQQDEVFVYINSKNLKDFENKLEDIVSKLSKTIKEQNTNFNLQLKLLNLPEETEETFIELLAQWLYSFEKFKTNKKLKYQVYVDTKLNTKQLQIKIENIYWVRDLMNMPPNELTPTSYEKIIKETFKNLPVKIKVIKWDELNKMWAWWIYSVWKWSINEPRMIILTYSVNDKPYKAVVWKWVTFDAWGYNLKPTWFIEDMNLDMWWSAVALWIFKTLVENKYNWNLICAVGLVENLVSDRSYLPWAIIKMYNWKTVKIQNTDAEWRLVLADTISYIEKNYRIDTLFDFATLTWAAVVSLWHDIIAIMWKNKLLNKKIQDLWWKIKERAWELPLYEKYKDLLKSDFADINNCWIKSEAWTITAWLFLSEFVKTKNWVHFDIAWPWILKNHYLYWDWWSWMWVRLITKLLSQQ